MIRTSGRAARNSLIRLKALLHRHDDVGDDDAGPLAAEGRQSALAVLGEDDRVAPFLQNGRQCRTHAGIVVDDQDRSAHIASAAVSSWRASSSPESAGR